MNSIEPYRQVQWSFEWGETALRVRKHRLTLANFECLTDEAQGRWGLTRQLMCAFLRGVCAKVA
jgi:hypothetical protein